ncbi:alcohol acetyltransferase [Fusarium tricinctum]|uniref:Alcohol acetyltransferase n=1 Tax=Fusarium tricinctum TaxID=61284 RepID=A0A8K0WAW0_9HYPO|nr:alcohol acetyltransferase [Fusarium tricinctum]
MAPTDIRTVRRLGLLETGSSAYHLMGLYRCVVVSARYTLPPGTSPSNDAILAAMGNLINDNPILRVGIQGEGDIKAFFTHITEMKLQDFVEFRTCSEENYEKALEDVQCWCHDQFWQDIETRSPWRAIVLRPGETPGFEDIVFAFHHSLMDGMSGRLFHEKLLAHLNDLPPNPSSQDILQFPELPTLPEPQEKVIDYTTTLGFRVSRLWSRNRPSFLTPAPKPIWFGEPIDFDRPHKARLRSVDIPAEVVSSALAAARSHGTSITGLLHTLILVSLSRHVPDAPGFASSTPMSMRPYISPSADPSLKEALFGCVTGMNHEHPPSETVPFRNPQGDIDDHIWSYARKIKTELKEKASTFPVNDDIQALASVTDWPALLQKKDGKPRLRSWELSNIGTLAPVDGERSISRALFTNGVMVASDPMSISVVSVKNNSLTLGITWCDGVVDDRVMENLAQDLDMFMKRLHEVGKISEA